LLEPCMPCSDSHRIPKSLGAASQVRSVDAGGCERLPVHGRLRDRWQVLLACMSGGGGLVVSTHAGRISP
jgi:hypothetical protein